MRVNIFMIREFETTMNEIARRRDCTIQWIHSNDTYMNFIISHPHYKDAYCHLKWADAVNTTDAGVTMWINYIEHREKKQVDDVFAKYIAADVLNTQRLYWQMSNCYLPNITRVIYSDPATIVFWSDKTKTVVKCQDGDFYDPEKGLAMAIVKKIYGNEGNYYNRIKKWIEPYYNQLDLMEQIFPNSPISDYIRHLMRLKG